MSHTLESLKATGKVHIDVFAADGTLKESRDIDNLVVSAGLSFIAARLSNTGTPTQMTHMALGSSDTTPVGGHTALQSAIAGARVALTVSGGTVSSNTITFAATFGPGIAADVKEAGVFNDATAGTMLCRTVFPTIPMLSGDTLTISWTVTIGA